ncbi:MAG: immunoglobulin domain-containing protein [Chloroflexota bacterium]
MRILTRMKLLTLAFAALVAFSLQAYSQSPTVHINEGFDGTAFPPAGWTNIRYAVPPSYPTENYLWERKTITRDDEQPASVTPYSGAGMIYFNCWDAHNGAMAKIATPAINISGTSNNTVSFYMYRSEDNETTTDKVEIYVDADTSLANGGTKLGTILHHFESAPVESSPGWHKYTFTIPNSFRSYGNVYVYFVGISNYGNSILVDEISIQGTPVKPDASVTGITGLGNSFSPGKTYPISVKVKNTNMDDPMTINSFQVDWSINGVAQTPVTWTGSLSQGSEITVPLGDFSATYPDNGPYPSAAITATVKNLNNNGVGYVDYNPANDSYTFFSNPIMLDAYAVDISRPNGKFSPGLQDVYVRVRNVGAGPLNSMRIQWKVDGVAQTEKNWSGFVPYNQEVEVFLGQVDVKLKQPLAPTIVSATVVNPNVGTDENLTNNVTPDRLLAPSLLANTFKVGGANAHFNNFKEAVDYLNAAGILGEGEFTFMVAPGSYNGASLLGNFGGDRTKFRFIGTSAKASDAFINFESDPTTNYALKLQNISNLEFRNLTFSAQYGTRGTALELDKVVNAVFENVAFQGIAAAPADPMYAIVRVTNSNNVTFNKCSFTNGASAVWVSNSEMMTPTFNFTNNTLRNFTANYMIFQGGPITPMTQSHVVIQGNTMESTAGGAPKFGIMVFDGSTISNNKISGVRGSGASDEAAIRVIHTTNSDWAIIENNVVTDSRNVNGIYVVGANTKIYRNEIRVVSDYPGAQLAGITTINSNGYIADNISYVQNMAGMRLINSNAMNVFYNSVYTNSNTQAAIEADGSNRLERNMFIQGSNGAPAIIANGTLVARDNNYWSNAPFFATYAGQNFNKIATWNSARGDNSVNQATLFDNQNKMLIEIYDPAYQLNAPLADLPEDLRYEIEATDFYGDARDYFYMGYAIMNLSVQIQSQPQELISCEGAGGQVLAVTAEISNRADALFQWYKDGKPIPGATGRILNLDTMRHEKAGLYKALVYGPANAQEGVFTDEVAVYSLNPTEVTKQPVTQLYAGLKDTIQVEFEAHIRGIIPPYYKDDYQWYRRVGNTVTRLTDGAKFLGSQTPRLTIRNVAAGDYTATGDYYFAIVTGQCGSDTTDHVTLIKAPTITIISQPQNKRVCVDEDVNISTTVNVSSEATSTKYQWYYNGYPLANGNGVSGVDTKDLAMTNVAKTRSGEYFLEITVEPGHIVRRTKVAVVSVGSAPVITGQPHNIEAVVGKEFSMTILYDSEDNATIKWLKNNVEIPGETNGTLTIASATDTDAGTYTATITNPCGTVTSDPIVVTVKPTGVVGVHDVATGANRLLAPTPNPANGDVANLGWELAEASNVRVALLDATGREIAVLFEGASPMGVTNREFAISNLNLSSGVYFVVISGARFNATQPLVIVK